MRDILNGIMKKFIKGRKYNPTRLFAKNNQDKHENLFVNWNDR